MIASVWGWLALGYAVASRLAYVLYVGIALRRQERSRDGGEESYQRFRRVASRLMTNDAVALPRRVRRWAGRRCPRDGRAA